MAQEQGKKGFIVPFWELQFSRPGSTRTTGEPQPEPREHHDTGAYSHGKPSGAKGSRR
jgi:hypothetical protein